MERNKKTVKSNRFQKGEKEKVVILGNKENQKNREAVLTDYSRRRLLTYADSFRELADSLDFCYEEVGEDRQLILEKKRLWEKQQVICRNMTEVSKILTGMAGEVFQFRGLSDRQYKKVVQALRMERIFVSDVFLVHMTDSSTNGGAPPTIGVRMYTDRCTGIRASDVADMISVLLDHALLPSATCPHMVDTEEKYYFFVEEPVFMVMPGYAKATRENECVSGDNYSLIESVKGRLTVLLSDGMGSGEKACQDSERVLDLMEKMMEAGYDVSSAVSLVNSTLTISEEGPNMSTLDVCSVDLYSGMCQFRKVGAATTFLKSNTYVEQITMNTLPLGVFQKLDTEAVTRELIENDYIIMVTDGIIDALAVGGYEDMLGSYLEDLQETNPTEIAGKVLQLALRCSNGRIMDDMTVVVLGVFRAR